MLIHPNPLCLRVDIKCHFWDICPDHSHISLSLDRLPLFPNKLVSVSPPYPRSSARAAPLCISLPLLSTQSLAQSLNV